MKGNIRKLAAWICTLAMVAGLFGNIGPISNAAGTDAKTTSADATVREWYVYGDEDADTGIVVTDTTDGKTVTSGMIRDAGVNLPSGLIEANMNLQVKLTVEGSETAVSTLNNSENQFELANELYDCGELSWSYKAFALGSQTLRFAFKDAMHTNNTPQNGKVVSDGKTPFNWEETINFFRFYQTASTTGLKITVNEIKIVYGDHGLKFGDTDTYLQLDETMSSTPKAVEVTVNMPTSLGQKSWVLREGTSTSTSSGHTLGSGVTGAGELPGTGVPYSILDATGGAVSGFRTLNNGFGIDATGYELKDLAVAFWVWSSSAGTLGTGDQFRIGSGEFLGGNALIYYYSDIQVSAGWNYIELPLDKWKTDIKQNFTVSNINCFGFTSYNLAAGQKRYFGEFRLVALETKEDNGLKWTLRKGSNTTTSSGHTMTTGKTVAGEAPGGGVTYSILDASSSAISKFGTRDTKLGIDATGYGLKDLAVTFWVWSNAAGTLGTGDQFRLSSNTDNVNSNALIYYYSDIPVEAGWNYISLPLDKWKTDIKQEFTVSNINSFGFTVYNLSQGQKRYFTDFELVVLEPASEWTLAAANKMENTNNTITTGKTTAEDAPGAGVNYFTIDASSAAISRFSSRNSKQGINAGAYTLDDLSLTFWVWSNNAGVLGTGDQFRLGSGEYYSGNALIYYFNHIQVEEGWNYIELPLNTWKNDIKQDFTVESINSFGFSGFNLEQGQIRRFTDFKLVASGKGKNWTLCDTSTKYNNNYGLSYKAGSVSGDETEPEVGTKYAKIEIPKYNASVSESGKFGFELPSMPAIDASANPSDYAVGFWLYSSTGMMPSGQFELNSSKGANDSAELHWYPQNWNIQKGWNYITINLGAYASDSTPNGVDFSNINYLRWYSDNGAQVTQDTVFAITDITFIKANTKEVLKTLCKAENQPLWYGRSKTVQTIKEGPKAGTSYMETTVPGYTGAQPVYKSCFGFFTTFNSIDASAYDASNLTVSMWVYTATGKLPGGQIEINSSGTANDSAELAWFPANFNSQLQIGWNKLELNLASPHYKGGSGIDFSNINYIRWYTDESESAVLQADTTFRIGEIKLYADEVDEGDIRIMQNAKVTSGNYMIFSNANRVKEANPFAVFVTEEGYPAVLCNDTQFTLRKSICNGTDVKLKVVRTNAGAIQFYINDELKGSSKTVVSDLGAPTKAYSIGADGKGAQVFVGTMKDLKVYSNVAATKCVGYWPLIGDIKYVTETMPDISGQGNDAYFAGSRANEWYDAPKAEAEEGEWSLVYIPEMCQRFYTNQHAIYHKSVKWIAEDVNELKHDNIKYVVGDKTADGGQLNAVNRGYDFFETSVPSTNLNEITDNNHTYYRFQAGDGVKWMIMSLNVYAGESAYTWAKEIANQYPNDNIIVATDVYTSSIYNELGSRVKLIISGGIADDDRVADGVPAMILPAQNDTEKSYFGGEQEMGLLYVLRFTDNGRKVTSRTYAPVYGKYFDDSVTRNIGSLTVNLEEEPEKIAEQTATAKGGVAPKTEKPGYKFAGWYQQYEEELVGKTYAVYDAKDSAQTFKTENYSLSINAGAYELSNLAVQFWLYSNTDSTFAEGSDSQLRLSSSKDGLGANFVYWSLQNRPIEKGWNLITLPLDKTNGNFSFDAASIRRIGFVPFELAKGSYRYITDMELVVLDNPSKRWLLYSSETTATKTGQTLTTGVTDGYALPLGKGASGSNVYAKYVDSDVLGVKAQVLGGTNDRSNYTNIRFLTSVDSLDYKEMGFYITLVNPYKGPTENDTKKYAAHNYVYKNILAMDNSGNKESYSADSIFSSDSRYFKAFTIKNVPNWAFSENFTVQPYWITMDGTTVYGDEVDKNVWMGYPTEHLYLPQIVNTTYETDDVVIATIVPTVEKYGYHIDPTGTDDCTEELQRALNDCHNMGGGTVYLPAGEYLITDSLTIPSNVTLRGDWYDPDKKEEKKTEAGYGYGTFFHVIQPTTIETIGQNTKRNDDVNHNGANKAAFYMQGSAGVVGITVYYPGQDTSDVQEYPYTFYIPNDSVNNMLITLKDITVINGYRGVGTSYEKQHECLIVDNFKGTFLDCGLALYNASDTGRITGVSISSEYWEEFDGTDVSDYVRANATGMEIGDLEWQQFSNCRIDGYNTGISVVGGYRINFVGAMIDMSITNCTTGFTIAEKNDDTYYYNSEVSNKTKYPLNAAMDRRWGSVIARSTIVGDADSDYSIVNNTKSTYNSWNTKINQTASLLRMTDVSVDTIKTNAYYDQSTISGASEQNIQSSAADLSSYDARYSDTYEITAAQRKNLWVVDLSAYDEANTDVSGVIQSAISAFMESSAYAKNNGGIVYIPGGTYRLDNPITVPAGIELRGASAVANREQYQNSEGTLFLCYYGDDAASTASDKALITLAGDYAGVSGLKFLYPENVITNEGDADTKSTYTISAKGASNVHVVNTYIAASSYGVNVENCENFWLEGIYACCYLNTMNAKNSTGVIRGCLSNPNMIARTNAKGLTAGWPEEAGYNVQAPINDIRNNLMTNLKFITLDGCADVLVQDVLAYASNRLVDTKNSTTLVMNANADLLLGNNGYQFYVSGGNLTVINALRTATTTQGESTVEAYLYNSDTFTGTVKIYNSLEAKGEGEDEMSAYEENVNVSK